MKRRLTIALTFGLLLALAVAGAVLAQGTGGISLESLPGSGWWVSWQVQNVGDADATLQVEAIPADGKESEFSTSSASTTLAQGAAITFIPGHRPAEDPFHLDPGFIGSAVLSADQPIVAIGNVANNPLFEGDLGVEGGLAAAMYQGVSGDDAATQLNFPLMKYDWFGQTTTFYVQAAGQAASVTMTYKTGDGNTYTDGPYELAADEMHVFSPADAGVPEGCTAETRACIGSAVATSSSGPIVGVYTEHETVAEPGAFVLSTRGFTPADADNTVAAPVIKNGWYGRTTGLTVQNAEASADVTVNVTFTGTNDTTPDDPGEGCKGQSYSGDQATLGPGESTVYFPTRENMGGLPEECLAAAIVTSEGGKVVAVVNETGADKKTVYGAFGVSKATQEIALPAVKEYFYGRTTGVVIQNVGDADTDVTVTYSVAKAEGASPGTVTLPTITIPAEQSVSLWGISQRDGVWGTARTELQGTNSGVIITSSSENVVAIAQESAPEADFDIKNYEGFNLD